jgi:hypothetical protein
LRNYKERPLLRPKLPTTGIHFPTGSQGRLSQNKYSALVGTLLAGSVFLCLTDFFTTSIAIKIGLTEGNYALIALSRGLGLDLLATLAISKVFFLLGCCAASLIGVKMRGSAPASMAVLLLAVFGILGR